MGKPSQYKSLQQNPSERILDDRPAQDPVPPASLLYEGFGSFLDIFRCRGDIYDLTRKRRKLELAVNTFAEAMTTFFGTENERRTRGLNTLNAILSLHSHHERAAACVDSSRICQMVTLKSHTKQYRASSNLRMSSSTSTQSLWSSSFPALRIRALSRFRVAKSRIWVGGCRVWA